MKIAIVGGGISGLKAAYDLSKVHQVTLYESSSQLGGHAHTVDAYDGDSFHPVDTGFLVYNETTYPHLIALFDELGVETMSTTMSFSYRSEARGIEWKGTNLNTIFSQRRNLLRLGFWRMVRDILRFNAYLRDELKRDEPSDETLRDLLNRRLWSQEFVDWYLIPMGAAIWSANPDEFTLMPARSFAEFFSRHGLLNVRDMPTWRTVVGGSRTYVDKVASAIRARGHIHVDAQVSAITRGKNVQLTVNGVVHEFDHVVVACHSDQALALLTDPTTAETEVLGAIRYQDNQVTLHWDEKILPRRKRAWAAWNYHDSGEQKALATLTYNISLLQHIKAKRNFLVSLNSRHEIDQDKVLAEFNYAHPVIDQQTIRAQRRRREINTATTSFCGAYFGFGFHEDGARSASEVFAHIEGLTTRD